MKSFYLNFGTSLSTLGLYEEAAQMLEEYARLAPEDFDARFQLGAVYQILSERSLDDRLTERAVGEQPGGAEAEQRAEAAAQLTAQMRVAAAVQAKTPHPEFCQLGGRAGCALPAEIKVADSWGDSAWGCAAHVEEILIHVRSVFIASEELGGLAAYLNR